jgi:hypothetical protein
LFHCGVDCKFARNKEQNDRRAVKYGTMWRRISESVGDARKLNLKSRRKYREEEEGK